VTNKKRDKQQKNGRYRKRKKEHIDLYIVNSSYQWRHHRYNSTITSHQHGFKAPWIVMH